MAEHIRSLGYGARSHTNRASEVLHIPLILEAGLGEMSRIGELVLNPFVGPRFKSVVLTTDMPVMVDKKIDFGLQDICGKCTKCARECPCGAISFGDKIMFNGYETWKPDVEKCTKYRLGNMKGAACGRCMKTCPFNTEGVLSERFLLWLAIKVRYTRRFIIRLDDRLGNGSINPVKKWWWDLEWKDGQAIEPEKGTNARGSRHGWWSDCRQAEGRPLPPRRTSARRRDRGSGEARSQGRSGSRATSRVAPRSASKKRDLGNRDDHHHHHHRYRLPDTRRRPGRAGSSRPLRRCCSPVRCRPLHRAEARRCGSVADRTRRGLRHPPPQRPPHRPPGSGSPPVG